ncbi:MAG TPA: hypothetical protein VFY06_08665, partial [Verrucomicrobiae bacterium]|nr:hypothetical protein [Verrucomicrobiae bacterium]
IFVFLEEHPDSINDGYFVERVPAETYNYPSVHRYPAYSHQWIDLPATYHNLATAMSFADGHSEFHNWSQPGTYRPPFPNGADLPIQIPHGQAEDYNWVLAHMSIEKN